MNQDKRPMTGYFFVIPVGFRGTEVVSSCLIPRLRVRRAGDSTVQCIRADKGDGLGLGSRLMDLLSMFLVVYCL